MIIILTYKVNKNFQIVKKIFEIKNEASIQRDRMTRAEKGACGKNCSGKVRPKKKS
jgi:hypothetical protein